jgi:glycosyltransferase involved in cell wall biosynthesis
VSVVVPTRNSARTLDACLASIARQQDADPEIVVVDNGSTDATLAIARRWASVVVVDGGPERSTQRNIGARHATGDTLLFIDSDMVLEPLVAAEVARLTAAGAGAVIVTERSFGVGFWAACRVLEKELAVGAEDVEAARGFARTTFAELGGYDEGLVGPEDWELTDRCRQQGLHIARTTTVVHHDEGTVRLSDAWRKKRYYGAHAMGYVRTRARRSLWRSSLLGRRATLARHPVRAAGLAVLKTVDAAGVLAGLIGRRRIQSPYQPNAVQASSASAATTDTTPASSTQRWRR